MCARAVRHDLICHEASRVREKQPMQPLKIFYSYAHEDKILRGELGKFLATFRAQGICEDWYDGDIRPGDEWEADIKEKLSTADIILLLISADFLASPYIRSIELSEAMRRHSKKEARVIPIMLRPCVFKGEVFSKLQGLPSEMKPVTTWTSQDEAWTDVVSGLDREFEAFRKLREAPVPADSAPPPTSQPTTAPPQSDPLPNHLEGLSAAQEENRVLAETSTEAFQGLRKLMDNPRIKTFVAEQQCELESAEDALQKLVDYKNVHDRLHDLQFKCYNYIFQEARKVEDDVDWKLIVQPRKDLASLTERLQEAATRPSMSNENFDWVDQLVLAGTRLCVASEELTLPPLQESGKLIRAILEIQPTVFDTKLCAAAEVLPLDELRSALGAIRQKLSPNSLKSDEGVRFSAGVDALPDLSANLKSLTDEHARWQAIATTLWSIDALIDEDLTGLQKSWPKLFDRLKKICAGNPAVWAVSILNEANNLDRLLALPAPGNAKDFARWQKKIGQSYTSCSTESGTRFYQVDLSLKRLCDQLRDVQAALARLLQELP
jgi:TIR domain-containing protein